MISKGKISHIICIIAMLIVAPRLSLAQGRQLAKSTERFGTRLLCQLAKISPKMDIVFSPFSLQTGIAMARMGAKGETALEIDQGFGLYVRKTEVLANNYHAILAQFENSSVLKTANKIYAMTGFSVQEKFNELLTKQFYSSVDSLNFADSAASARTINSWVEENTNNLIRDLVSPSLLDESTRLVLVNAIHFKANWNTPFDAENTRPGHFYLDDNRKINVPMMFSEDYFGYAELVNLDAKALELPYEEGDFSMLLILPNKRTGLDELLNKLKYSSINDVARQITYTSVFVRIPKFKATYHAELSEPLRNMGMKRMFSENAEFDNMLKSGESLKISSVIHEASIAVTESGTEAAAATVLGLTNRFGGDSEVFIADHGFFYAIRSKEGIILFEGVQTFEE